MSTRAGGFVALLSLGGGAPDPAAIGRPMAALAPSCPDGASVWAEAGEPVALGQGTCRDAPDGPRGSAVAVLRRGPLALAGTVRLDDRATLGAALRDAGAGVPAGAAERDDGALVAAAYQVWGEACVEQLAGDFAFALWDGARRRLVCARDQFGVRPLYYATVRGDAGDTLVVSNVLDAVLAHPGVSDALAELPLLDLLLFGWNPALETTAYAAVRCVPPAHLLTADAGGPRTRRYWRLPVEEPLRLRRPCDYADALREHLAGAVGDRLPDHAAGAPVAIAMSGGRDSPAIALTAQRLLADRGGAAAPRAFTATYERLMPGDREREFAELAAAAIGIPITVVHLDRYRMFERWDDPAARRPEPTMDPLVIADADFHRTVAAHARVMLDGSGGDAAQRESASRLARLALDRHLGRALWEGLQYLWYQRRLPRPGIGALRRLRRGETRERPPFPQWLDPAVVARYDLRARWEAFTPAPVSDHPTRPEAYRGLAATLWPRMFESQSPGASGLPLDVRYPFFDLRLVRFLLRVPPAQWTNDKGVLQLAMRGRLPRRLLQRPKAPLAGEPFAARLWRDGAGWLDGAALVPAVRRLLRVEALPALVGGEGRGSIADMGQDVGPVALSMWIGHHWRMSGARGEPGT